MSLLALANLSVRRGARQVVAGVSLAVGPGEFVGLVGPNGAGKTTLLKGALGLLPVSGESSLVRLDARARARAAAFLPQGRTIAWPVSVADLVALGRLPHGAGPGRLGPADRAAVAAALAAMGLVALAGRRATELSGGEQARALIARVLAQEAPLVLADEPVAGLDPAAQIAAMATFRRLAAEGRAVIAAVHDLGLALRHCTRLVLLAGGRVAADGAPAEVLSPERVAAAFGIRAFRAETPDGPVFQPLEVVA